jgi:hypothetical protein
MMIEYEDAAERQARLSELGGVEDAVWVQVAGGDKLRAIADEDLEREEGGKTSAVHFLRFELPQRDRRALKAGAGLAMGIDHEKMRVSVEVEEHVRAALAADLS